MRVRWPFVVAPVLLVLGLCGWLIAPSVQHAWRSHALDAKMRPLRPGIALMTKLPVPAGTSLCRTTALTQATGVMCRRSTLSPVAATSELVAGLHSVSATNVVARCVTAGLLGPQCTIRADLAGVGYQAYIQPQVKTLRPPVFTGSEIVGGMSALGMIPSRLPAGTSLAVPS